MCYACAVLSRVRLSATRWTVALQARILEWVAAPFSGRSSQPRIDPRSPALRADSLLVEPPGKPKNTGVGNLSLLQGIFPTQKLNWVLLHGRRILYQLSYQGSLEIFNMSFRQSRHYANPGGKERWYDEPSKDL